MNSNSYEYITKPKFMRRFAAWIIDFFCVIILFFGFSLFLDAPINNVLGISDINASIAQEALDAGVASYQVVEGKEEIVYLDQTDERYIEFFEREDIATKQMKAMYLAIIGTSFELLLAETMMCFIVPLLLKNGQTFGKKVFHIGVISQNGLKMKNWQLALRSFVGIFLIETVFSVNFYFLGAGLLLSFIIAVINRNHLALHDYVGNTIVIDLENTPIFDSIAEREEVYPSQKTSSN